MMNSKIWASLSLFLLLPVAHPLTKPAYSLSRQLRPLGLRPSLDIEQSHATIAQAEEQPIDTPQGPLGNPRGPNDEIAFTTCQTLTATAALDCRWTRVAQAEWYEVSIQGPQLNCVFAASEPQLHDAESCDRVQKGNTYKLTVKAMDQHNQAVAVGERRIHVTDREQP